MFKCNECGLSKPRDKQYNFIRSIRKANYVNKIRIDKTKFQYNKATTKSDFKIINRSTGKEIVKEEKYCKKCLPKKGEPIIVGQVIRENIVGIKRIS